MLKQITPFRINEPAKDGGANPYKHLAENDRKEYQRLLQVKAAQQSHGHYTDEHIDTVTKDFCQWVEDLGGAQDNIDEETVGDLFAIGHESKPTISVPLNVIQLIEVPKEVLNNIGKEITPANAAKGRKKKQKNETQVQLRTKVTETKELMGRYQPKQNEKANSTPFWLKKSPSNEEKKIWSFAGPHKQTSQSTKFRYGAWYLKPTTWKKLLPGDSLQSPESKHIKTMNEARSISSKFDEELAPMHVTKSFMKYVNEKQTRKPAFFGHLQEIQDRLEHEEQVKQQEAMFHKQRLLSKLYHVPQSRQPRITVGNMAKV